MKERLRPAEEGFYELTGAGLRAVERRDFKGARGLFVQALNKARSVDDRRGELLSLINLARVSVALGDYKGARAYLNEAAPLAEHIKDPENLSEVYATLSKVEYYDGTVEEALVYIDKAIELDKGIRSKTLGAKLNMRGFLYMRSGRTGEAERVFAEAVEVNRREGADLELANSYRALASLREDADPEGALELYKKAHAIDSTLGDPEKIAMDLILMAEADTKLGRTEEAAFLFERAYRVSSSASLEERALYAADRLIPLLKELGRTDEAAVYEEMKKRFSDYQNPSEYR